MALTTYAELKAAVADWAWGEVTEAQVAADLLPQVQSKMYHGDGDGRDGLVQIKPLRVRAMISSGTLTPSASGQVTISTGVNSGWLEFVEIRPTTSYTRALQYLEPWEFYRRPELQVAGPPDYYTIEGDTLYTGPYSSSTLTAIWYQKFTALSGSSDTDWALTNAPQIYLNGCLMEACAYLQDEREASFRAKFAAAIAGANINNRVGRTSGSPMRAIPRSIA